MTAPSAAASGDGGIVHRPSPDVDASSVGDRVVLYHRGTKQALVLNPSGSYLWDLLADGRTSTALGEALLTRYPGLDRERASADAAVFVDELRRHDMLLAAR